MGNSDFNLSQNSEVLTFMVFTLIFFLSFIFTILCNNGKNS